MQRRGGSGQPAKGQSANRPEARETSTAQVATADLREQVAALTRDLGGVARHLQFTGPAWPGFPSDA